MRLIQIAFYPLFVDLVGTAVACQRVHVSGGLFKLLQVLLTVVQKQILVVNVIAVQQ
ncbi:hypothetical protein D3C87_1540370 [compost metagenome]